MLPPLRHLLIITLVLTFVAACGIGSDDDTPAEETDTMYCELIDPETVAPLSPGEQIRAVGTPTPKSDVRRVDCNLYGADSGDTVLLTTQREFSSAEQADAERAKIESEKTRYSEANPEQYTELDSSGLSGYAWFDGTTVYAHLMTESRAVLLSAPTTTAQADVVVGVLLEVALVSESNLDAWDAKNPSD